VDRPVRTAADANKVAQSICDEIGNSFVEADGLCYNHPEPKPNFKVKLSNIGQRFNGTYMITATTHTFSAAEGFSTQFVISGKQPATLLSILGGSK
jgi:phage protein D